MTLPSDTGSEMRVAGGLALEKRALVIAAESLIACDVTFEAITAYVKPNLARVFQVAGWAWQGRAVVQRRLGERVPVDFDTLPVNETLAALAQAEALAGRPVYLASSGDGLLASGLMRRFPFVKGMIADDSLQESRQLAISGAKPGAKSDATMSDAIMSNALARRFPEGFDYIGGANADLGVGRRTGSEVDAGPPRRGIRLAAPRLSQWRGLVKSLRLHQWTKNLLVFAPFILGGELDEAGAWLATAVAFLALGLVASSTYLVNDILDVADDRRHWSKRRRPIASGLLPVSMAALCAAAGLTAGLALAFAVSRDALQVMLVYTALTLAYSLAIKRLPLVDGLALATLFTLRLGLGVAATAVPPSAWLFVFSMFIFASLSFAKRYTELDRAIKTAGAKISGRGYRAEDVPLVLAVGVAAGLGAVIILILYIIEDAFLRSFYGATQWLWGFPLLVFLLICRIWLVTVRGEMNDDPVKFMIADTHSQVVLGLLATCFAFAWLA